MPLNFSFSCFPPLLLTLSIFPPFFLSRCRFDGFLASDIIAIFWRRHPIQRMLLPLPLFAPFLQGDLSGWSTGWVDIDLGCCTILQVGSHKPRISCQPNFVADLMGHPVLPLPLPTPSSLSPSQSDCTLRTRVRDCADRPAANARSQVACDEQMG